MAIIETVDGLFPEKPQEYHVQYKKNGQWFTPAKRYDLKSAQSLYDSWSTCTTFDEVIIIDNLLGMLSICYPSENRYLDIAGEKISA